MYKSHEVQDRILKVNNWKLSSWGGSSTPDIENSFQDMCSDENSSDGCCFLMWGRVRNYLAQYLKLKWLIPDDSGGLSKPFMHLENNLPDSHTSRVMHLFLSKVCWCLRKRIPSVLLSLALELPFMNFDNSCHLIKNSTNQTCTWREEMSPFAFNLLLADAHLLSRLNSDYLLSILPVVVSISFLPFSRILMAFSVPEIQYCRSYFGKQFVFEEINVFYIKR